MIVKAMPTAFTQTHHWTRTECAALEASGLWERQNLAAPIDVAPEDNPTNEPEPDVIVLKRQLSHFLVVEIADTSLNFDLTTKAALYARAGIAEYWVLDVTGRRLLVHRDPKSSEYASIVAYGERESVAPLAAPQAEFRVADAFPA